MEWVRGRGLEGRRCREEVWRLMGRGWRWENAGFGGVEGVLSLKAELDLITVSKGQLFIPSHQYHFLTKVMLEDMRVRT